MVEALITAGRFGPFIMRGSHNRKLPRAARFSTAGRRLYHLVAVEDGTAELTTGHRTRRIPAPAAFLLPPDDPHMLRCDAGSSWGELVFQIVHAARAPGKRPNHWTHQGARQPDPARIFGVDLPLVVAETLVAEAIATVVLAGTTYFRSPLHHAEADAALGRWLLRYARARATSEPAGDPWSVAERIARDRLDSRCTVADMAAAVGLGTTAFTDGYRTARGRTPGAFLTELRLEVAGRELAAGRDIRGTAHMCGFRSPTSFTAFFKRHTGMAPTAWRRSTRAH